jgi:hypothetical protein
VSKAPRKYCHFYRPIHELSCHIKEILIEKTVIVSKLEEEDAQKKKTS